MARPRRNSSIHEPSPLARLFVRSPDGPDLGDRLRERRQSIVNAINMPSSSTQPTLSSVLSPMWNRRRSRADSQPLGEVPRRSHASRPSVTRIEEDPAGQGDESVVDPGPPPLTTRSVRFPRLDDGVGLGVKNGLISPRDTQDMAMPGENVGTEERKGAEWGRKKAAKASEVEEALIERPEEEREVGESVKKRLERLEEGQRRITELLEVLVGKAGDGTSAVAVET
jgi:hypothetical protein